MEYFQSNLRMTEMETYYNGELRCTSRHPSGVEILTDAPKDNHGKGESFSPTDLFVVSIASCMATIMGIQARALKLDLSGMSIKTTKEMSTDRPRRIKRVCIGFDMHCSPEEKQKKQLIQAAESCPVSHSLSPDIELIVEYHWSGE